MADPDVRQRMLDNLLPATTQAYGPEPKQVGPGQVVEMPEAPDDEATEGEYVQVQTNGHATVDTATGEIVAETGAEPDWFGEPDKADAVPALVARLRKALGQKPSKNPVAVEQRDQLRQLWHGVDVDVVLGGLAAAFDYQPPADGAKLAALTEGQASAVLAIAGETDADAFRQQWAEMAKAVSS